MEMYPISSTKQSSIFVRSSWLTVRLKYSSHFINSAYISSTLVATSTSLVSVSFNLFASPSVLLHIIAVFVVVNATMQRNNIIAKTFSLIIVHLFSDNIDLLFVGNGHQKYLILLYLVALELFGEPFLV